MRTRPSWSIGVTVTYGTFQIPLIAGHPIRTSPTAVANSYQPLVQRANLQQLQLSGKRCNSRTSSATAMTPPTSNAVPSLSPEQSAVNSFNLRSRLFVATLSFRNILPSFLRVFRVFCGFSDTKQGVCRVFTFQTLTAGVSGERITCDLAVIL